MKTKKTSGNPALYTAIRGICEKKRLTIAQLEREAGLGNGVVRKWNSASPTLRTVIAVANCLDVSLEELISPLGSARSNANPGTSC